MAEHLARAVRDEQEPGGVVEAGRERGAPVLPEPRGIGGRVARPGVLREERGHRGEQPVEVQVGRGPHVDHGLGRRGTARDNGSFGHAFDANGRH
ncbi:hypothetical protein [Streptomyces sp. DfronAA-171]|uniref:hypothetical protein n=1 Tax=Streptomyces sp. DfronAA-171 TaxID=1839777 RepID=UPI00210900FC|nr:hypothetical protein [Streptomyces sp. DfronAA-171]